MVRGDPHQPPANFRLCRAAAKPMMKARFGRIVSITSVVRATGNPGQANYAASKAGVTGMTKALAQELASRNVTVNCIAPGFIATAMTEVLPDAAEGSAQSAHPGGPRMGEEAISPPPSSISRRKKRATVTGQTIHVNGGMAMLS